jgi:hypothetical protein
MEAVKSTIRASLLKEFGPGSILELDTTDRCIKIELPVSCDHVIYVRPDHYEKHFLCHYAHKADLEVLKDEKNGDLLAWKQQNVAQLSRMVKGSFRDFATATMWYAKQAAERIEMMKEMGGRRRDCPMLATFKEARITAYHYPEPKGLSESR